MTSKEASEAGRALVRRRWDKTAEERRQADIEHIERLIERMRPVSEAEAHIIRELLPPLRIPGV
jgi:hypothetical protein